MDYKTTVSSTLGSLVYLKNETRKGYFRTMPLDILAELSYLKPDGSQVSKTLSGSISSPQANRHYEIFVDASIYEGMASIRIFLDDTEAETEVILVSDSSSSQINDGIAFGGLLISEIMFDPSSLTDTYGEWFEIKNTTSQPVNLKNLNIRRDSTNIHTIIDSLIVSPGGYFVFKRAQTATDVTNSYTYGSDISLPNTGAVLSIFN